jgi:hypothetical protein
MTTAVDTNVLLDVFLPDPVFGERSLTALEKAYAQGALVISEVAFAELAPHFAHQQQLEDVLRKIGVTVRSTGLDAAFEAGARWMRYRRQVQSRDRVIPDFLVGAFALHQADQLLTRDRGFYRHCFQGLRVVEP